MGKILELNGLRGAAALIIFFAHAAKAGFLSEYLEKQYGQVALLILFVLSGFLISQHYLDREFTKKNVYNYAIARAARIFPAYIMVLILSYLISSFFFPGFHYNFENERKLIFALLFISSPYELWSIPVEVQFYATFIIIWMVYQKVTKKFLVLLLIPLAMGALGVKLYLDNGKAHNIWLFAITFFIGTAISYLVKNKTVYEKFRKTPAILSVATFILTLTIIPLFRKLFIYHLAARFDPLKLLLVISSFLFIVTNPDNFKFLRTKPMLFLGEISFAFYLTHRPIIEIGKSILGTTPSCFVLTLFATTIVAAFSTYAFEKPAADFIKSRFSRK